MLASVVKPLLGFWPLTPGGGKRVTILNSFLFLCFTSVCLMAQAYTTNDDHEHAPKVTVSRAAAATYGNYVDPTFANYPAANSKSRDQSVQNFRVMVLSDMVVSRKTHAEWGYSALVDGVDADGKKFSILFDTGAEKETVWYNIQKLIDPDDKTKNLVSKVCSTSIVILSHNHQAHVAGLLTLRSKCVAAGYPDALKVAYLGGAQALWSRQDRTVTPVKENNYLLVPAGPGPVDDPSKGTIEQQYKLMGGTFVYADTPVALFPGVWTSGKVARVTGEKQWWQYGETGPLLSSSGAEFHDSVPEDHGLVINSKSGLVVFTGCGHAGIVNIIEHAQNKVVSGGLKVVGVIGGVHLFAAKTAELDLVVSAFIKAGVKYVLGSHCTGIEALLYLRQHAGLLATEAVVGTVGSVMKTHPTDDTKIVAAALAGPMLNRDPALN